MTSTFNLPRRLLTALPLTLCSALAMAAPPAPSEQSASRDLQRVEVSGYRPRVDVRASCPAADQTIQDALAMPIARHSEAGLSTVRFKLKGDSITEVSAIGGPIAYRQAVRRAVRSLDCKGSADEQLFSFQIKFTPAGEERDIAGDSTRVALLMP